MAPAALPPAERRRVGKGVKVALDVGFEAVAHAGREASTLASIFTSSSGDGDNCDAICRELTGDRMISPTRFHNSVHNAPSGYWGIASGSMHPSTSLCAFDDSFVAGLEDALTQLACGLDAMLLVAYDAPYPEPLHAARPTPDSFGVALVLTREPEAHTLARIETTVHADGRRPTSMSIATPTLEDCRMNIPAARALPLLASIAHLSNDDANDEEIVLGAGNGTTIGLRVVSVTSRAIASRGTACA